jgi:DNA-directed RNA polymerase specialized sigma24 family protein
VRRGIPSKPLYCERASRYDFLVDKSKTFESYVRGPYVESIDHTDPKSILRGITPLLWKSALKIKRPHSWDVEDVLQIGILAVIEQRAKYDPARGKFLSWAAVVAWKAMFNACVEGYGSVKIHREASRASAKGSTKYPNAVLCKYYNDASFSLNDTALDGEGSRRDELVGTEVNVEDAIDAKRIYERCPEFVQRYLMLEAKDISPKEMPEVLDGRLTYEGARQRKLRALNALGVGLAAND